MYAPAKSRSQACVMKYYLVLLVIFSCYCAGLAQVATPPPETRPMLAQPLAVRWRYASDATINLTPAVKNERVYVPLAGGSLVALNAADGSLLWKNENGGEISCSPEPDEQAVYVASETGELSAAHGVGAIQPKAYVRAVNRATGLTLWTRTLPTPLYGLLVANEQAVFGVSSNGMIYALAKTDGATLWENHAANSLSSELTLADKRLYIGSKEGTLLALNTLTGQIVWRFQMKGGARGHIWAAHGAVYAATETGHIYALEAGNGVLRWQAQAGPSVQALAVNDAGVYAASFDNSLYVLNLAKGKRIWRKQLSSRLASAPLAASEGVLLTSMAGNVATVLHPRDGKILNTLNLEDDGSTAAAPVFAQNVVLITARRGILAFANPNK